MAFFPQRVRSMAIAPLAVLPLLLLSVVVRTADASARFLVTDPKPRCFGVEIPSETTVKIHYEAPDSDTSGRDASHPSYITLLEKPVETLEELRLETATDRESLEKRRAALNNLGQRARKGAHPVSNAITDPYGSFVYQTHGADSLVEVCVRDGEATPRNPRGFHLRVEELEDFDAETELDAFEQEKRDAENRIPLKTAEHHWSFLEAQLDRIEHEVHTIIREADYFRERDALYHQQTDDLHKATLFWPILHCGILLVTGFTQANHIIRFFKDHRII